MRRVWMVEGDGRQHRVELEHGWFSGKRVITVDGQVVNQSGKLIHRLWDTGSRHELAIGTKRGELAISWRRPHYTLRVDGDVVEPQVQRLPRPGRVVLAAMFLPLAVLAIWLTEADLIMTIIYGGGALIIAWQLLKLSASAYQMAVVVAPLLVVIGVVELAYLATGLAQVLPSPGPNAPFLYGIVAVVLAGTLMAAAIPVLLLSEPAKRAFESAA